MNVKRYQGLIFSPNKHTITVKSRTKKYFITERDFENFFLRGNKILLKNGEDLIIASAIEKLFGDIAFIDGEYLFITENYRFSHEDFIKRMEKFVLEDIESRRCPKYHNIIIRKDGTCKKFTECLIKNGGIKPDYCIAVGDVVKEKYDDSEISYRYMNEWRFRGSILR